MSHPQNNQQGFSTVELLIALFVAAAFIGSGFQLFSTVLNDGADARLRSRASNVAHEQLRRYVNSTANLCSAHPPSTSEPAPSDLPNGTITVDFSCPYGANSQTTRIEVTVEYGTPATEIQENLDVSKT